MITKLEKEDAIKKLKENRKRCAEFNFFGHSNYKAIDIIIDVIYENRDEVFVFSNYQSDTPKQHEDFLNAITGLEFLRGEHEIDDLLYPI